MISRKGRFVSDCSGGSALLLLFGERGSGNKVTQVKWQSSDDVRPCLDHKLALSEITGGELTEWERRRNVLQRLISKPKSSEYLAIIQERLLLGFFLDQSGYSCGRIAVDAIHVLASRVDHAKSSLVPGRPSRDRLKRIDRATTRSSSYLPLATDQREFYSLSAAVVRSWSRVECRSSTKKIGSNFSFEIKGTSQISSTRISTGSLYASTGRYPAKEKE